jgi:hypothetical protein
MPAAVPYEIALTIIDVPRTGGIAGRQSGRDGSLCGALGRPHNVRRHDCYYALQPTLETGERNIGHEQDLS